MIQPPSGRRPSRIRLLLFDVDGVLTDGRILLHGDGSESKQFSIRDGTGLVWAQRAGLVTGLLSARHSPATSARAAQLGIRIVRQQPGDKLDAFRQLAARRAPRRRARWRFMGDDLLDLAGAGARRASRPRRPTRSPTCGRAWTGSAASKGGDGAAREFVELVLARAGPVGRRSCANTWRRKSPMGDYAPLLAALIALLAGLTVGKAWERYKLRDGRWFDRRKARQTPHYMLGLNFLVSNQVGPGDRGADARPRRSMATRSKST